MRCRERASHGVATHVLLDWVGSAKIDDRLIDEMTAAGVQVRKYHPPHWTHLGRLNNRTHRKLLIVDGRIAFTGGVGIAPEWTGHAQDPDHWRDTHFRVEGPVVAQMQSVFLDNWIKVTACRAAWPRLLSGTRSRRARRWRRCSAVRPAAAATACN